MRGRRPKPTALKRLQGNPGKRRLNEKEPQPAVEAPACPVFLQGLAREYWGELAALLADLGLMTQMDTVALAAVCKDYAAWREYNEKVDKLGPIVKVPSGFPVINPYVILAAKAQARMLRLLESFGCTPASRSRLRVERPAEAEDSFEDFLKRGANPTTTDRIQ
jgi:P27 family predicted phage terminase small subunit